MIAAAYCVINSGRWEVGGGRREAGGGRWEVGGRREGGRWEVAGGRFDLVRSQILRFGSIRERAVRYDTR